MPLHRGVEAELACAPQKARAARMCHLINSHEPTPRDTRPGREEGRRPHTRPPDAPPPARGPAAPCGATSAPGGRFRAATLTSVLVCEPCPAAAPRSRPFRAMSRRVTEPTGKTGWDAAPPRCENSLPRESDPGPAAAPGTHRPTRCGTVFFHLPRMSHKWNRTWRASFPWHLRVVRARGCVGQPPLEGRVSRGARASPFTPRRTSGVSPA